MRKRLLFLCFIGFYCTSWGHHNSAHFLWLMDQTVVKEALQDQFVIKTFFESTECRAAHCFNFVLCSVKKSPSGHVQFLVHRVPGTAYYFQTKLVIATESYTELPMLCEQ